MTPCRAPPESGVRHGRDRRLRRHEQQAPDPTVVYVTGEIDLTTRDTLVRMLDDAASGGRNVIVDLSGTTFMDSTGLKALLELRHSQVVAGFDLVLRNPSGSVLRTLRYAGLDDLLTIEQRSEPGS